jgi:hypothetical protein
MKGAGEFISRRDGPARAHCSPADLEPAESAKGEASRTHKDPPRLGAADRLASVHWVRQVRSIWSLNPENRVVRGSIDLEQMAMK